MNNELYHYGVLGMRWGVRRYQNKDGTLTAAGKKHSSKNENDQVKKKTSSSSESDKKTSSIMSDDELRKAVNRLQLEKQYRDLYKELNPKQVSLGKKFVDKVLAPALTETAKNITKDMLNSLAKDLTKKMNGSSKSKAGMTMEELRSEVQRLTLEQQYKKLKNEG